MVGQHRDVLELIEHNGLVSATQIGPVRCVEVGRLREILFHDVEAHGAPVVLNRRTPHRTTPYMPRTPKTLPEWTTAYSMPSSLGSLTRSFLAARGVPSASSSRMHSLTYDGKRIFSIFPSFNPLERFVRMSLTMTG